MARIHDFNTREIDYSDISNCYKILLYNLELIFKLRDPDSEDEINNQEEHLSIKLQAQRSSKTVRLINIANILGIQDDLLRSWINEQNFFPKIRREGNYYVFDVTEIARAIVINEIFQANKDYTTVRKALTGIGILSKSNLSHLYEGLKRIGKKVRLESLIDARQTEM